jgi:phosphate transport system ATP-binding protein
MQVGARSHDTRDAVREDLFGVTDVSVFYGGFRAVRDVSMTIFRNQITALIGPSGCGKTTFIRCFNRMNDLVESARLEGRIL